MMVLLIASAGSAIDMKGVSYTAWQPDAMLTADSDASLAKARDAGCNWIAICVWWFQDNADSTVITPDYTRYSAEPNSVIHAIERCHELCMKVMLKPMVDCRDGDWRGNINPSAAWFAAYEDFITYWADLAQSSRVEFFSVGCEFKKTVSWSSSWRSVIQKVKNRYSGLLTYSANHGNERNMNWWDDLDCIGIDAYYSLTSKNNPTLNELKTAWSNRCEAIENWRSMHWPNMDVVFAEVGYQSVDSTNRTPWWTDPSSHAIDLQEQADCYEALLSECRSRPWWLGAFWWNWQTSPAAGGADDPYWTPQNKPAEDVLRSHYKTVAGDLDDDRDVDFYDFVVVAGHWLGEDIVGGPDIDCDGNVNFRDVAGFAEGWLPSGH